MIFGIGTRAQTKSNKGHQIFNELCKKDSRSARIT